MKKTKEYIAVVAMVIILFIIPGCSGDVVKPPPPEPEIFADISGFVSLHFESVVMVTNFNSSHQINFSGFSETGNKYYGLTISIFYLDSVLKTGTYNFRRTPISGQEYAVGAFILEIDKDEKIFMSDSGTIIISEINGLKHKGTFNFYGSTNDSSAFIKVENGILETK